MVAGEGGVAADGKRPRAVVRTGTGFSLGPGTDGAAAGSRTVGSKRRAADFKVSASTHKDGTSAKITVYNVGLVVGEVTSCNGTCLALEI